MGLKDWLLLFTTGAAIVGPFLTTWFNNRNAASVLKTGYDHEQEVWKRDHRIALYDDALQVLGRAKLGLAMKDSRHDHLLSSQAVTTRLLVVGSEDVRVAAQKVEDAGFELYVAKVDGAGQAWDKYKRSVDSLAEAIREDMGHQVS